MKNKKNIFIIITFIWLTVMFVFSMQPMEMSQRTSKMLAEKMSKWFVLAGFEQEGLTAGDQLEYYNFILRKCAHLFVYFILGILSAVTVLKTKLLYKHIVAVSFCVFVAIIGEVMQLFIDGRTAKVQDVLINATGAIIGIILVSIYNRISTASYDTR